MNPYAPPRDTSTAARQPSYRLDSWYNLVLMILFMMAPGLVLAIAASL
jgi:hypothetical protein